MGVLLIWLVTFLIVVSSAASKLCDRCVHQFSNVTFFSNDDDVVSNACGYGTQAKRLIGDYFASVKPVIYRKGVTCGACYQVRCKDEKFCREEGTTVIVTDVSNDNRNDFVLSKTAFYDMFFTNQDNKNLPRLIKKAEYQRVPCNYEHKNMIIRVEETSKKKEGYLAIQLLHQRGQANVESIEVARAKENWMSQNWVSLTRTNYGAVWDTSSVPPKGALKFQFKVETRESWKYYTTKPVLPANWTNGVDYDSGIQITDINATPPEACETCSNVWN